MMSVFFTTTIFFLVFMAGCHGVTKPQVHPQSTVLVNLTPHQTKLLSVLKQVPPAGWPRSACKPAILPRFKLESILGKEATDALTCYTSGTCADIHTVDALSNEELEQRGYTSSRITDLRKMSRDIGRGLARAPLSGGFAYRVIKSVPSESVADLIEHWQEKKPIGMGEKFRPALASASWDTSLLERRLSQDPASSFHLLYVINSHKGVAIEELSPYRDEREIVLPNSETYLIEKIAPLADKTRILRVDISRFSEPNNPPASSRTLEEKS